MMITIPFIAPSKTRRAVRPLLACCITAALLAGCARPEAPVGMNDPAEPFNRQVHAFNRSVDEHLVRPFSSATKGNGEVSKRIGDFAANLGKPADIVNNVLQLRLVKASENLLRFGMNTVFGVGGLFDVASAAGMPENDTDFGETLHIWGVKEGAYLEMPFLGPTTERDLAGTVVDMVIDPLNNLPKTERNWATGAKLAERVGDRGQYSDLMDSVLYDSADSYAQARLLYLQNRRFELGQTAGEEDFVDPYEDPYAE